MNAKRRIGILVTGGDAPGVNAVLRAATYRAADEGLEVVGLYDGWQGLLDDEPEAPLALGRDVVRTWYRDGGSNLGASRVNPFRHRLGDRLTDRSGEIGRNLERHRLEAVIAVGGAGTVGVAHRLAGLGLPVVLVPKTIDLDVPCTDYTIGFDTACRTVAEIVERARTPAGSHHWVQVIEVMGGGTGHLALLGGNAGGASIILIPEAPFDLGRVLSLLEERLHPEQRRRRYPRYAVVVVAEGAFPLHGSPITVDERRDGDERPHLGGVGHWLAEQIRRLTPHDTRALALGHLQRGGSPSHLDRNMGWLFGVAAVEAVLQRRWGTMVAARTLLPSCDLRLVPLAAALSGSRGVDVDRAYDTNRYCYKRRDLLATAGDEGPTSPEDGAHP